MANETPAVTFVALRENQSLGLPTPTGKPAYAENSGDRVTVFATDPQVAEVLGHQIRGGALWKLASGEAPAPVETTAAPPPTIKRPEDKQ